MERPENFDHAYIAGDRPMKPVLKLPMSPEKFRRMVQEREGGGSAPTLSDWVNR